MPYDPRTGEEVANEDWELWMEELRKDMATDLGPLTIADYPTQAEIEEMARQRGVELPF